MGRHAGESDVGQRRRAANVADRAAGRGGFEERVTQGQEEWRPKVDDRMDELCAAREGERSAMGRARAGGLWRRAVVVWPAICQTTIVA